MSSRFLTVLMACCMWAGPAHAGNAFKWVDEQGVTHYSQTPPPGQRSESVAVPGRPAPEKPPAASAEASQPQPAGAEQPAPEAGQTPDQRTAAEREAIGQKVCQGLREDLAKLEQYPRIFLRDAQGKGVWLTPEERQQRIDQTKKQLQEMCKP